MDPVTRKSLTLLVKLLSTAYVLCFILFIILVFIVATREIEYENVDLVAIYTGAKQRIEPGIALAKKVNSKYILISGVHSNNGAAEFRPVLKKYGIPENKLILGKLAQNTRDNAFELKMTMALLDCKSAYLVTSDYHIVRSYILSYFGMHGKKLMVYPVFGESFLDRPLFRAWALFREFNGSIVAIIDLFLDWAIHGYIGFIREILG